MPIVDGTNPNASQVVTIDAIFIAQQFERINTTLEYMKKAAEDQVTKEAAQDLVIGGLVRDVTEMKSDIRAIKESRPARVSAMTWIVGAVAVIVSVLSILDRLYLV